MTIQEALKRAEELEQQGCITTTSQALITLAAYWWQTNLEAVDKPEGAIYPRDGQVYSANDDW